MRILLTGGAGYIGSHIAVSLIEERHRVSIADNLSNSYPDAIDGIEKITGVKPSFYDIDVADRDALLKVLEAETPDCIIHLAGFKSVGESVREPLKYYRNNIVTTLTILECMKHAGIKRLVFSSSATVYGDDNVPPFVENMPRGKCSSPYGWTKSMQEQIIEDFARQDEKFSAVILRYFNPIGAHESGLIGENPKGNANNLIPYISKVASGEIEYLTIFGSDYDTPDGTCRRDYIHVMDLADGHIKAAEYTQSNKGVEIFNLGTGMPYSVLDIVKAFSEACDKSINYEFGKRREGDVQDIWADPTKAREVLGWKSKRNLQEMCRDAWNWQIDKQKTDE